jgi:hypothetical protein
LENHQQKISHLKALYHLASADKVLSKSETIYITTVANRLGVNLEELGEVDGSEPELILPGREYMIYSLFHRLAIILMIDGSVHEDEKTYCFNLGIKMGLHPNAIGEIIEHVSVYGAAETSPKVVMDIFRKYLS